MIMRLIMRDNNKNCFAYGCKADFQYISFEYVDDNCNSHLLYLMSRTGVLLTLTSSAWLPCNLSATKTVLHPFQCITFIQQKQLEYQ